MAKQTYNCSELELYTICNLAWKSCLLQITRFASFKPKYTAIFISDKVLAVKTASELPDEQARNEAYETASINLKKEAKKCTDKWQMLKRYIADAYPADLQKPKLEAAGQDYTKPAYNDNWDSVNGLMVSGLNFINNNLADLTANNNMPATFQSEFDVIKTDFEKQHQTFLEAEENSTVGQDKKITANNTIHTDLMSMLLDGQEIFKNEEPLYKQFVFAELLYLASGTGTAGIRGTVYDIISGLPIGNIKVTIKGTTKTTTTDADGKYEITQVAAGKYIVIFEGNLYETLTITDWQVKTGTVSTLDVKMTPKP